MKKIILLAGLFICSQAFAQTSRYFTLQVIDNDRAALSIEVDDGDTCLVVFDSLGAIRQLVMAINHKSGRDIIDSNLVIRDSLKDIKELIVILNNCYKHELGWYKNRYKDHTSFGPGYTTTHTDLMIMMEDRRHK